jgi:hypothetical protein
MKIGISNWLIWNVDPTKISDWHLFLFTIRLKSQNHYMKLRLRLEPVTYFCIRKPAFPIGIFDILTPRKWWFCLYLRSLQDYYLEPVPETEILTEILNVNLYMKTAFPVGIFEIMTLQKWVFCLYFTSLNDKIPGR